jgi:hypothetical protein
VSGAREEAEVTIAKTRGDAIDGIHSCFDLEVSLIRQRITAMKHCVFYVVAFSMGCIFLTAAIALIE